MPTVNIVSMTSEESSGEKSASSDIDMPGEDAVLHKRPFPNESYGEPPAKKTAPSIQLGAGFKWNLQALSAAADAVQGGGKSPVSALNELGVRVLYTVRRQSGPAHCPSFTVTVTVSSGHCQQLTTSWESGCYTPCGGSRARRTAPASPSPSRSVADTVSS
ncbi:uncharacterized protein LOC105396073 [Plutella xylostella]|uniref:uncharacterized protein LOC105396073 n=1 Tax=Plutella xylostella TaxID=51655 RepID=UPI0020321A71|nr:uncharacterized protein LOC105396073 [Plutella xylostella]